MIRSIQLSEMRFITVKVFLLLFILSSGTVISAQDTKNVQDVKNVDVNKLPDSEIQRAKKAMDEAGLTLQQAIELARQRGATEQQIMEMRKRLMQTSQRGDTIWNAQQLEGMGLMPPDELPDSVQRLKQEKKSRIFGADLFTNENLTFEPSLYIQTPKNYELGIGDQLIINIWGNSQNSYQLTVNTSGQIIIPDVGPVYVAGMAFNAAEEKIKQRLTSIYADMGGSNPQTFAQLNIGRLRSIRVNLVGEVSTPGTYTLPVTATVFNALYLSGGPDSIGSFRTIKVIRNNKIAQSVDIYKFLVDADPSDNVQLMDQDIVLIPPIEKRVEAVGEFKRTGLFEMKEDETVADLIRFAGGFTGNAYRASIQVQRKTQRGLQIIDVPMDKINSTALMNGDVVSNGKIQERFVNRVTINGAVNRPGEYEFTPGMLLTDLIYKADSLKENAFLNRGLITRLNPDSTTTSIAFDLKKILSGKRNIALKREDMVLIKSRYDLQEEPYILVAGEVNEPGQFDYSQEMTLGDAIFLAGGLTEAADSTFVEVARRLSYSEAAELSDDMVHIFTFNLSRGLNVKEEDAGFKLLPFDRVAVRRAPGFREQATATVIGEVKYSGDYAISNKNQRISDLIRMAGGTTPQAYTEGASFTRKTEELGYENVAINLKVIMNNPGSENDLLLRDGDELNVPEFMQTVKVSGSVQNPFSITWEEGKSLQYYINRAGGYSADAMIRKTYVKYANGSTATTRGLFNRSYPEIRPGSQIVVPQKPVKENVGVGQWLSIASAFSSIAVAIAAVLR